VGYLEQTRRPLHCLAFLLPMLAVYEVGIFLAYPPFSTEGPPEVMAKVLLSWFMELLGATGVYLPGLIVVLALLGWHLARKDPWQIDRPVLVGMAGESALLALPLLLWHAVLTHRTPLASADWADSVLLSMSAGIYEELVFRLLLISLLTFIMTEIIRLKSRPAEVLAVVLSSLLFAAHHCKGFGGSEPLALDRFVFRFAAGIYLAGVFVLRGFGIAVGSHTAYDVIVVSMR
jgi:hypothetical protein